VQLEVTILDGGDAGRIVAAIFKPPQGIDEMLRDRRIAQDTYDTAHACQPYRQQAPHRAPAVVTAVPCALSTHSLFPGFSASLRPDSGWI
jgi:hypothetical protein